MLVVVISLVDVEDDEMAKIIVLYLMRYYLIDSTITRGSRPLFMLNITAYLKILPLQVTRQSFQAELPDVD